jgi:arylsulfatase A
MQLPKRRDAINALLDSPPALRKLAPVNHVCWILACLLWACGSALAAARQPNIIFILADDLGYGDIGAFGQKKIKTPHLDRLAAEGMRFTQHYSGNAVCAPSRCVLLTGKHPGHAWIRDNKEVQPEGQPPLPANTLTLARFLQQNGYATCAVGKWGLGFPSSEGEPLRQGFDRFFGYNCQRVAHNYYPTSLWNNSTRVPLDNPAFLAQQKLSPDADLSSPATFAPFTGKQYAPDVIRDAALEFIRTNATERPFFLYYATTVPHLALQVPEDSLAEYRGQFPDAPYTGTNGYLPHAAPRAAYAAMITRMDRDIGQLIALIREKKLEDDTLFVFTSDNGPLYDQFGGTDTDFFESAGALRGRKGSLYEGGVRVPLIVKWKGHVKPGSTSDRVTGFEDWFPTIAEIVRGDVALKSQPSTLNSWDGESFAKTLRGEKQPEREFLYREFPNYDGWQSVRAGDWKLVRSNLKPRPKNAGATPKTELFNLKTDPAETRDLSAQHPEVVARLMKLAAAQHIRSELFPFPALDR